MSKHQSLPTVAVLNSNSDFLELIRHFLNAEGFVAVTLSMSRVKNGEVELVEFIREHTPKVIVYDIAFPYRENWTQCEQVRNLEACENIEFILTTPNLDALEHMIGKQVGAFELIEKEIDLRKVVAKIKEVWQKKETGG